MTMCCSLPLALPYLSIPVKPSQYATVLYKRPSREALISLTLQQGTAGCCTVVLYGGKQPSWDCRSSLLSAVRQGGDGRRSGAATHINSQAEPMEGLEDSGEETLPIASDHSGSQDSDADQVLPPEPDPSKHVSFCSAALAWQALWTVPSTPSCQLCMADTAGAASGPADTRASSAAHRKLNPEPAADKRAPQLVHRTACHV